eukprot:scaffold7755_cov166-Amphora_coffeaeformis.AAC.2
MTKRNLTLEQINALIGDLLDNSSIDGEERVLARGTVERLANKVYRHWKRALENRKNNGTYSLKKPPKQGRSGRQQLYDREEIDRVVGTFPIGQRSNLRDISQNLGITLNTAWRIKDEGTALIPHSNSIKPFLTDHHKLLRAMYAADRVCRDDNGQLVYRDAYDEVHVDEKWFEIEPRSRRIYLSKFEKEHRKPVRRTQSKQYMPKRVPAMKNSKNRKAGTIETKAVNVSKSLY